MLAPADLLARYTREHGGEVHLGKRVQGIRIENGKALGIELQNGDFIPADWVVSSADLNQTCFQLIGRDHLSLAMIHKLENVLPSESLFAAFWA